MAAVDPVTPGQTATGGSEPFRLPWRGRGRADAASPRPSALLPGTPAPSAPTPVKPSERSPSWRHRGGGGRGATPGPRAAAARDPRGAPPRAGPGGRPGARPREAAFGRRPDHAKSTPGLPQAYPRPTPGLPQAYPRPTPGLPQAYPRPTPGLPRAHARATPARAGKRRASLPPAAHGAPRGPAGASRRPASSAPAPALPAPGRRPAARGRAGSAARTKRGNPRLRAPRTAPRRRLAGARAAALRRASADAIS